MNSRYQLLDILQQDEQSRVLLLLDEISGRKAVCRKVHVQADPVLLHQLQQEASLLSVLDHPGFPALLDAFEEDQQLCLIRSWCPGITLQEKLKTRLPAKEKKRIFSQVLCLLEVIHDHGFLYLDLKADRFCFPILRPCRRKQKEVRRWMSGQTSMAWASSIYSSLERTASPEGCSSITRKNDTAP